MHLFSRPQNVYQAKHQCDEKYGLDDSLVAMRLFAIVGFAAVPKPLAHKNSEEHKYREPSNNDMRFQMLFCVPIQESYQQGRGTAPFKTPHKNTKSVWIVLLREVSQLYAGAFQTVGIMFTLFQSSPTIRAEA
jgi:hypothetical protein